MLLPISLPQQEMNFLPLPPPHLETSPTATPAVAGNLTSKTTAVERFEGGLVVIEAKKDKVQGCPSSRRGGFYSGRIRRRSSKFFHRSNPKPLPTQMTGCSLPSHGLDQKKFRDTTSLMVRNIPSRLRGMLINFLDKHCEEVNAKIGMRSSTVLSAYDFVYLPIDFSTGLNKGYAFVNFTSKAAADQFKSSYQGHKWHLFSTKKVCQIDDAQIQGRENLISHFQRTTFPCAKEEYLPVQFTPPRNGSSQFTSPSIVGLVWIAEQSTDTSL